MVFSEDELGYANAVDDLDSVRMEIVKGKIK